MGNVCHTHEYVPSTQHVAFYYKRNIMYYDPETNSVSHIEPMFHAWRCISQDGWENTVMHYKLPNQSPCPMDRLREKTIQQVNEELKHMATQYWNLIDTQS